jgi:S-adenosyl methyltransferase
MYVDNDPLVLAHARALLTSTPEGVCDYIDGDLRDPEAILAEAARTLDFGQPVALMLLGVLHHIPDTSEAQEIVRRLVAALAPGSYEATNHSTSAVSGAAMEKAVAHWYRVGSPSMTLRTPQQIARFRRPGPAATQGGVVLTLAAPPHRRISYGKRLPARSLPTGRRHAAGHAATTQVLDGGLDLKADTGALVGGRVRDLARGAHALGPGRPVEPRRLCPGTATRSAQHGPGPQRCTARRSLQGPVPVAGAAGRLAGPV